MDWWLGKWLGKQHKECDANEPIAGITSMASREAPLAAATADPPEAAQSGDSVPVFTHHDEGDVLLYLGTGGATAGDYLESDANGAGVTAVTTAETIRYIGAQALETGSAGEYIKVSPQTFTITNPA